VQVLGLLGCLVDEILALAQVVFEVVEFIALVLVKMNQLPIADPDRRLWTSFALVVWEMKYKSLVWALDGS
jgi:hypothetical protein